MNKKLILTGGIDVGNSDTKSYLNILTNPKNFLGNPGSLNTFPSIIAEKSPVDVSKNDLILNVIQTPLKSTLGKLYYVGEDAKLRSSNYHKTFDIQSKNISKVDEDLLSFLVFGSFAQYILKNGIMDSWKGNEIEIEAYLGVSLPISDGVNKHNQYVDGLTRGPHTFVINKGERSLTVNLTVKKAIALAEGEAGVYIFQHPTPTIRKQIEELIFKTIGQNDFDPYEEFLKYANIQTLDGGGATFDSANFYDKNGVKFFDPTASRSLAEGAMTAFNETYYYGTQNGLQLPDTTALINLFNRPTDHLTSRNKRAWSEYWNQARKNLIEKLIDFISEVSSKANFDLIYAFGGGITTLNKDFFGNEDNWLNLAMNNKLHDIYGDNAPFMITVDGEIGRYANTFGLSMQAAALHFEEINSANSESEKKKKATKEVNAK